MVLEKAVALTEQIDDTKTVQSKSDNGPYRDADLVARAQKEDPWATEQLVRRYQKKAYSIAYRMCDGDNEAAQELTQEAFLNALRNIKKFKGKSSFYTWFYRIVVNTCLDARRRNRRRDKVFSLWRPKRKDGEEADFKLEDQPDLDKRSDPVDTVQEKELKQDVQKVLGKLPEKQRVAFQLKVFQEMRISEIAEIMGSAEGTVKSHLFRATHTIRKALKGWVEA